MKIRLFVVLAVLTSASTMEAALKLPNVFGNHMVVQQKMPIKVWGWTNPGQDVTVAMADKTVSVKAGSDGRFEAALPELVAGGPYKMTITADETVAFEDVLVGEVWVCSGQSNMQWNVNSSNDPDLEKLTAKFPKIRMINFPHVGSQEPLLTHDCQWMECTPDNVGSFSAVGYFFARQLHQTIDVPIGMVNNAWGGSACEAWINRDLLNADEQYKPMMDRWVGMEKQFADLSAKADLSEERDEDVEKSEESDGWQSSSFKHLQRRAEIAFGVTRFAEQSGIRAKAMPVERTSIAICFR